MCACNWYWSCYREDYLSKIFLSKLLKNRKLLRGEIESQMLCLVSKARWCDLRSLLGLPYPTLSYPVLSSSLTHSLQLSQSWVIAVRYLSGKWSQAILGLTVSSRKSDVGASWGVCTDRVRQKKLSEIGRRLRLSGHFIKSVIQRHGIV